jgi:serine/threonine-protein kinase
MSARFAPQSLVGAELPGSAGRWHVAQLLASGGIAHVYLARPSSGGAPVALKVMRPELADRREVAMRFDREARAALRVRHENVVEVYEPVQRSSGLAYFSAEHLVGVDLADLLASQKALSPARAIRVVTAIARGLGAAHAAGVVHRDVKPENIFLVHASDGREVAKLLDFGSAWISGDSTKPTASRITVSTGFVGTPGYMPSEQAEGAAAHPTADVYAIGVVLYEALAGSSPFSGRNWVELVHKHATLPVPRLRGADDDLWRVIERATAKRPEDRFPSMAALEEALSLLGSV